MRVQVRVIVSGTGDWRYVDCVSSRGGKLQALERVRTMFSVPKGRCVAAGDSGNDILMLEGRLSLAMHGHHMHAAGLRVSAWFCTGIWLIYKRVGGCLYPHTPEMYI